MSIIVQTKNLSKKYGTQMALNGLNMTVKKGEVYGLVGNNGAGKTTLIKLLFGLALPTSGEFQLMGVKSSDRNINIARLKINGIVETPAFYPYMNATQNLKTQAIMRGLNNPEKIASVLYTVGLHDAKKKKVKNFSLGMKQRLGIAQALLTDAELIILDEPTNGLDPEGIIELRELIKKLNRNHGITFLISSHYISELEQVITALGVIKKGEMFKELSKDQIDKSLSTTIHVEVDDTAACITALQGESWNPKALGKNIVVIENPVDDIGAIWRLLSEEAIAVHDIRRVSKTLEKYVIDCLN